jgi:signal transduction histidine kinase
LYGYSKEEFLQLTAYDVRVSAEHQQLKALIESGEYGIDNSIRAHRKKDGTVILIEPTITEINYKGKQAFLISINDVTEKIKMQEDLRAERTRHQKEVDRATLEAQEKSRAEIGRELHNNINQLLVASTLFLKKVVPASEKDKSLMQTGTGIISNAIEEIRRLSSHFVPPSLNDFTLTDSIEFLSRHFKLTETDIIFDVAFNEQALDESFKINIYRIIQEQFNNIIKHAAATKVDLQLKQVEHSLTLLIQDNGKGFDKAQKTKGIGLANIIHRAALYNGRVTINSAPGEGCELVVVFNLAQ